MKLALTSHVEMKFIALRKVLRFVDWLSVISLLCFFAFMLCVGFDSQTLLLEIMVAGIAAGLSPLVTLFYSGGKVKLIQIIGLIVACIFIYIYIFAR
jgi:hypothetical protein